MINSLIVAEASFKKSPVIKLIANPYQDYVQEYNEKNKDLILENQAKKKAIANKQTALEKKSDADTKEMSDLAMELSNITNADSAASSLMILRLDHSSDSSLSMEHFL